MSAKVKSAGFSPTPEQLEARDIFATRKSLKINAFAGTGKTSTLELLARSTDRTGVYLAFNRAIVDEAKARFGSNTRSLTIHSMAWRSMPKELSRQKNKMTNRLNAKALESMLELEDIVFDQKIRVTGTTQAYLIQQAVGTFLQSEKVEIPRIKLDRYCRLSLLSPESKRSLIELVDSWAKTMWERMSDASNRAFPLGHDGYVKLWSLSNPEIPADFILLDEAQDTNPVALSVLRRQDSQIVYVGDKHQQIYDWRGAINAMEEMPADEETYLTKSFRFGLNIAALATKILFALGERRKLLGNGGLESALGHCVPDAILARTNIGVMTEVISAINEEKRCHVVGDTRELKNLLRGVVDLKNGQPSKAPEFFGFSNWEEVLSLVEDGEGDQLEPLVRLVQAHGERHLLWALNRTEQKEEGVDIVISTAHKAKGREWSSVRLSDDFMAGINKKRGEKPVMESSEARLLYVAITRAKQRLDVPQPLLMMFDSDATLEPLQRTHSPNRQVEIGKGEVQDRVEMGPGLGGAIASGKSERMRKKASSRSSGGVKRSSAMDDVLDELGF